MSLSADDHCSVIPSRRVVSVASPERPVKSVGAAVAISCANLLFLDGVKQVPRTIELISKWGEQPDYAKARSESRDSTWTYSEGRARKRQSNRAAQPILR